MEINEKSKNQFNADTDAYKILRTYGARNLEMAIRFSL